LTYLHVCYLILFPSVFFHLVLFQLHSSLHKGVVITLKKRNRVLFQCCHKKNNLWSERQSESWWWSFIHKSSLFRGTKQMTSSPSIKILLEQPLKNYRKSSIWFVIKFFFTLPIFKNFFFLIFSAKIDLINNKLAFPLIFF
jgi:hypothetical protein